MSEHRKHLRGKADVRIKRGTWKHDPPQPKRGRMLWGMLVLTGLAVAVVVADDEWAWRDSLRRIAHGQEIPAFRANEWADAAAVRAKLADDLLKTELTPTVEDKDKRRTLALYTLISAAGDSVISQGDKAMGALMEELCLDVDWLEEMVCFCPMVYAETALPILAHIYRMEKKRMAGMPANRRLAAATAFEFARVGLDKEKALAAYLFYAASGQKHWLNGRFSELTLWQMSVIAARMTDETWSNTTTLAWFQRNCSLPSRGYITLGNTLGANECSLFGEPVDSVYFRALYRDAAEGGTASVFEASGCSTERDRAYYVATAACANGVPALVASAGQDAACLVDVDGKWEASSPTVEGMTCTWSFLGQNHLDFVQLASALGAEMDKTLSSYRLAHMAQFLYDAGNQPLAHSFFREAVKQQPLNYAAWLGFHACGGSKAEIAEAVKYFDKFPSVAAAIGSLSSAQ